MWLLYFQSLFNNKTIKTNARTNAIIDRLQKDDFKWKSFYFYHEYYIYSKDKNAIMIKDQISSTKFLLNKI